MNYRWLQVDISMERFAAFLLLVSVFLLALCKIEDTDAWTHLVYGKAIWDLKGIPATEPYIYSLAGTPFGGASYMSWLFGLLYYGAYHFFDIYGVIVLKATIVTLVFYVLLKDSLRPKSNYLVSVIVLSLIALMTRHRFVERPDTVLFLFLSFSVFALNAFVYDNKKYLYALPIIHFLWANSQTSISLMFLLFAAFLAGGVIQQFLYKKRIVLIAPPSRGQLKIILYIFIASFSASLVNPNFIHQYTLGAQILNNEWFRKNLTELSVSSWANEKGLFILSPLVMMSFLVRWRRIYCAHFILLMSVLVLAFTTRRFTYIFYILAGPILVRNIVSLYKPSLLPEKLIVKRLITISAVLWIVLSTLLTLAKVKPFGNSEKDFGFGINYVGVPEGALAYMDEENITGRVFNTFQWGQYITWRDFPRRSAIVDGRGNVPSELLPRMDLALDDPEILDGLYTTYGFESILIYYNINKTYSKKPATNGKFDARLSHPGWALVYWDDLSLLYVKRGGKYSAIAKKDEYHLIRPANNIELLITKLSNPREREIILSELQRNVASTGSMTGNAYLGYVYNRIGRYREAIECFSRIRDSPVRDFLFFAYCSIAYAHEMLGEYPAAILFYKKALREDNMADIQAKVYRLNLITKN